MASHELDEARESQISQKRVTAESDSAVFNHSFVTAFKKMKIDADGNYVKRTTHSKDMSIKQDTIASKDRDKKGEEPRDREDWTVSLRNFCFCEEGASNKKGGRQWQAMCQYHRLRTRKNTAHARSKSSLNLAQAVHAHRPLLQEGHLQLAESENHVQVMHSSHFNFNKTLKSNEASGKSVCSQQPGNPIASSTSGLFTSGRERSRDCTTLLACKATEQESAKQLQSVFAAAASDNMRTFSSLLPVTNAKSDQPSSEKETVLKFEGYRSCSHSCGMSLWPRDNSKSCHFFHSSQDGNSVEKAAGAASAPTRVDVVLEKSCSQEARLDESEFNANELAAYLENYLHLPREMSYMAKMMYT